MSVKLNGWNDWGQMQGWSFCQWGVEEIIEEPGVVEHMDTFDSLIT